MYLVYGTFILFPMSRSRGVHFLHRDILELLALPHGFL